MCSSGPFRDVPLPKTWPNHIKAAVIHTISLAHTALVCSRGWAADSRLQRVRLASELDRARTEISLRREEIRIKDIRMAKIPPRKRPFYPPTERMAILELKAARGWNISN